MECLLQNGAQVNAPTVISANCTSLHLAAAFGHHEVVKILLQHGANVNFTPMIPKQTPLHLAAINGHDKVAEVLLKNSKLRPDDRDENDLTALHWAASHGHINVVKQLLMNGANVNAKNNSAWSPMRGSKVNFHELKQCTPLHLAANNGHFEVVLILISFGADLNARNGFNWSPLHQASRNFPEIVKCLITFGAKIDQDLFFASEENCLQIVTKMAGDLQKNNCLPIDLEYLDSLFYLRNKLFSS